MSLKLPRMSLLLTCEPEPELLEEYLRECWERLEDCRHKMIGCRAQYEGDVRDALQSITKVTVVGMLWGIHLCISLYAFRIIINRGLRASLASQWQLFVTLLMLGLSTTHFLSLWISGLHGHNGENEGASYYIPSVIRYQFVVSDFIVVWRAWVLWPGNLWVKGTLTMFLLFSIACVPPSLYIFEGRGHAGDELRLTIVPAMIGLLPFVLLNIAATSAVAWKAWIYRREVQAFINPGKFNTNSSGTRVGRVLMLLTESGGVYTVFWGIYLGCFFAPLTTLDDLVGYHHPVPYTVTYRFEILWGVMMAQFSAMYPAIIIILVHNLISQHDIVNGSHSQRKHGYIAPHREHPRRVADRRISTLHFATRSAPDLSLNSREHLSMTDLQLEEGRMSKDETEPNDSVV